jgi:hypothetical protein
MRLWKPVLFSVLIVVATTAEGDPPATIPDGYQLVWQDQFTRLSLRKGGPTFDGLEHGTGVWSSPGATYSEDPRGVAGYGGYDWFADPSYYGWPDGYNGEFAITHDGLRIRTEPPIPALASVLPRVVGDAWTGEDAERHKETVPWLSGQLNSYNSVRIRPPFYFEVKAKMPEAGGHTFSAIWLATEERRTGHHGINYEVDVQEGFGDSDRLHSTIHWNTSPVTDDFRHENVVDSVKVADLSKDFHVWGALVTRDEQVFYFDGNEMGRFKTPKNANADQYYGIILDVSAGMPWKGGGPPSGGPHDMFIRYVKLLAPNSKNLLKQ